MYKCPNCSTEIPEGSSFCPHCETILNDSISGVDDELELLSKMIDDMESYSIEQSTGYKIGDFEKIASGEIDFNSYVNKELSDNNDENLEESIDEEATEEPLEEIIEETIEEPLEEEQEVIEEQAPIVFSASKKGVKKISGPETEENKGDAQEVLDEAFLNSVTNENFESILDDIIEEELEQIQKNEEAEEPIVLKNPYIDESLYENDVDISEFFGESLESEEELNELFDEISSYTDELIPTADGEDDELDLEERIRGGIGLTGSEVDTIKDTRENTLLSTVSTVEDLLRKAETVENIDKQVNDFLKEIESIEDLPEKSKEKSETYLKLNFVTADKFATLITSENERFDIDNDLSEENIRFTNIYSIETIVNAEKLTDQELESTMAAVNIQKDEIISSLEEEDKAQLVNKYIIIRKKMLVKLKFIALGCMLVLIYYFGTYMFEVDLVEVESSVYSTESIEKYDRYIYSGVLDVKFCIDVVDEKFEQYLAGQLTADQLLQICYLNLQTVNKYRTVFNKTIYNEAKNYTFQASNAQFFATYYIDNIVQYINTGDKYYLELNDNATSQDDEILKEIEEARILFLKELGYSDEEIGIMSYKARH